MEPSLPWLVVGLGNPGPRYAGTRHNVGEKVARLLAARHDTDAARFKSHRARAVVDEVRLRVTPAADPQRVVLAVPTTFMNDSGSAVAGLMKYYSVDLDQLIVVHDELDIPAGDVRVKKGGGEGGHNGLRSVSASLGSKDYLRVRVGVGRPPGRMDPADYVLRDYSSVERKELPLMLETAADAVESLLEVGLLASQQRFHSP